MYVILLSGVTAIFDLAKGTQMPCPAKSSANHEVSGDLSLWQTPSCAKFWSAKRAVFTQEKRHANISAGQVNLPFIYPGIKNMAGRRTAMTCEVNHRQKMKRHRYCKCVSVFASTVPFSQMAGHFISPLNTDPRNNKKCLFVV